MYSKTDNPAVQNSLRSKIQESERNINYLTDNLKKLELRASPTPSPQQAQFSQGYGGFGGGAGGRVSGGSPPIPPPKDPRSGRENGGGFDGYGGGRPQQPPGPPVPAKSRQYSKLGGPQHPKFRITCSDSGQTC
jgi:hypothetical protein